MLSSFVSPLRFGLLLALVLVLLWRCLGPRARWLGALAVAPCLLLTTPFAANLLVGLQETRGAASACAGESPRTIVVLGGGVSRKAADDADFSALTEASLRRLFAAADLQRAHADATLVVSGGISRYATSESRLLGALAKRLGVAGAHLVLEQDSRTTWQNARFVAALQPAIDRRIVLVTSALHMARARYAFEQAGFEVCTHAVDPRHAGYDGLGYFLPATSAVVKADAVLHELIGEAAYRLGFLRDTARDPHAGAGER